MKLATTLLLSLSLLTAGPLAIAQQRVVKIKFEVRDAKTGDTIDAKVTVDGEDVKAEYILPSGSESSLLLDVRADAGIGYYPRTMTLFLEALGQRDLRFKIHLAPRNPAAVHNRRSVAAATQFLKPVNVDRAVALLDAVVAETSPTVRDTQFGIYLYYNLWRAYFIDCTQRFVDHCAEAATLGKDLLAMLPNNRDLFEIERVPVAELQRSANELADHAYRLSYHRAKWNLNRNRPEDAAELAKSLLRAVADDPKLLDRLKISKGDIASLLNQAREAEKST
ncbi:hypothetical protein [Luteimonas kalidii]|uniref:Uncharacterized protein n=1 Tax=Luteimonas kalidii TaxID=3042025 RepID=A0ABT6JRS8_9GAMM|nr:hypothetical protein [Luteimonas kalidii]MDH5833395.1 hypothetical protein [Luteimonas kalidii]